MKKLILSIILTILLLFCFTSCSNNSSYEDYIPTQGSMFICIEEYKDPYLGDVKILVDRETRIMYMKYWENSSYDYGVSGITVIYNSEGQPKKYNGILKDE